MLAGRRQTVGRGTLLSLPRGAQHTLNSCGPGRARMLNLHTPDGGFAEHPHCVSD